MKMISRYIDLKALKIFAHTILDKVKKNPSQGLPLVIILGLCIYFILASGVKHIIKTSVPKTSLVSNLPTVRVTLLAPQTKTMMFSLKGLVQPSRLVILRPRTEGFLKDVLCQPGDWVQEGQVLAVLTTDQREIQLAEADADLKHRKLLFNVTRSLSKNNYQSETRLAEARATLEKSKVNKKKAELDLAYTHITAPFAGCVGDILAYKGVYLSPIDPSSGILTLADMTPLHVVSYITEKDYPFLKKGIEAEISDGKGHTWKGIVHSLSPISDDQTRSYKLEVRCDNAEKKLPQGMTVEIHMPKETRQAYALKLSSMCLNDQGVWGLKVVGPDRKIIFYPAHLLNIESDAVWVSADGLPQPLPLVTVGHGFVNEGQEVRSVSSESSIEPVAP